MKILTFNPNSGFGSVVYFAVATAIACVGLFFVLAFMSGSYPFETSHNARFLMTTPFTQKDFPQGMPPNGYVVPGYVFTPAAAP